jgi:nucleoside-triphosphatase
MSAHVLLITGPPGVGKTTIVRKVASELRRVEASAGLRARTFQGFWTEEIRVGGERRGFRAVTFDGWQRDIARVERRGGARVGRYGVDVAAIDAVVERALEVTTPDDLVIVDEIGKMECLSDRFVRAVTTVLDSSGPVIATVARRGAGLIEDVKRRPDVELVAVSSTNREAVPGTILGWLEARWRKRDAPQGA